VAGLKVIYQRTSIRNKAFQNVYSIDYIFEKFTMAIYELATGEGDARSRVGNAYYKFWHIKEQEFPDNLRKKRTEIDRLLTRLSGREGYIIPDNLAKMKNKTASKIASLILEIYLELGKCKDH